MSRSEPCGVPFFSAPLEGRGRRRVGEPTAEARAAQRSSDKSLIGAPATEPLRDARPRFVGSCQAARRLGCIVRVTTSLESPAMIIRKFIAAVAVAAFGVAACP